MNQTDFYEVLPDGRYKFRVDNHRLQTFTTCEELFRLAQMTTPVLPIGKTTGLAFMGAVVWRSKKKGKALQIGGWWSRCLELFYREMSYGKLPTTEQMLKFASDSWNEFELDKMEPRFLKDFDKGSALLMATQYYESYAELDFRNWKVIQVEAGFGLQDEVPIGENESVVVYYVGKPDLVVYEYASGKILVCDHKTVEYIKGNTIIQYKPHPQTAGYTLVAQVLAKSLDYPTTTLTDRCVINVAARKPPSEKPRDGNKKPRFMRAQPNYTTSELNEWAIGVVNKCTDLRHSIETGVWNRHENSCHIYGGCSFRGVCSVAPAARHIVLSSDFVQVEPWVPYDVEEAGDE